MFLIDAIKLKVVQCSKKNIKESFNSKLVLFSTRLLTRVLYKIRPVLFETILKFFCYWSVCWRHKRHYSKDTRKIILMN